MAEVLEFINSIVWGAPALAGILGVGLYISIRTRFVQLRLLPRALSAFFRQFRRKTAGGVSPMQALCTALAATVGTGNLAGVAGAIAIGGPGAIFWMWICALLGMGTKYAEATLAVHCRVEENGEYVGGPMYMIRARMGQKWQPLATAYAFFGVIAAFGVGNATQINALVSGINEAVRSFGGTPTLKGNLLMGLILAAVISRMLLGGAGRIGRVAERLVPIASAAYLLLGCVVLTVKADAIPAAFAAIVQGAFSPRAVTGGAIGSAFTALRTGVSRGVFTNEAGMGTASIAHAGADVSHPAEQGMMGIVEVFLDTIVICTMTALVILVSGTEIPYGTDVGVTLTTAAFTAVCGDWVSVLIAAALGCFAFATVLGWGLYGARCAQFLFGHGCWKYFAALQGVTVVLGAVLGTGTVWLLTETVNGLMAIPNLIILAVLTPELVRLTKEYTSGGTYENLNQRQSLRAFSHAKVSPPGGEGEKGRQKDLPPEHRPAGSGHAPGIL